MGKRRLGSEEADFPLLSAHFILQGFCSHNHALSGLWWASPKVDRFLESPDTGISSEVVERSILFILCYGTYHLPGMFLSSRLDSKFLEGRRTSLVYFLIKLCPKQFPLLKKMTWITLACLIMLFRCLWNYVFIWFGHIGYSKEIHSRIIPNLYSAVFPL